MQIKYMNAITKDKQTVDKAEIRELTEQWRTIWSPKDKPFTGKGFENIFATGENEILVFDNFEAIVGRKPNTWKDFAVNYQKNLIY